MKLKVFIGCILATVLFTTSSVLALSLGVSPTQIELEVPSEGSATVDVKIHYFSGEVKISLIDIPLRIEPETVRVEALDGPAAVELTIYGDSSLGSKIYDGYIRFIAVSGGAATGGVQIIARITNLVEGETAISAILEESQLQQEEVVEEVVTEEEEEIPILYWGEEEETDSSPAVSEGSSFPILPVAGIAAGTVIIITLIVVVARRYQY